MAELASVAGGATLAPAPKDAFKMQASDTTPAAQEVLKRYQAERQKRLRKDGVEQYIDPATHAKLQRFQADCWVNADTLNPGLDSAKNGDHHTVILLGAGFGSIVFAARLLAAGIEDIVFVDSAGGFGGTWYWNRYPGLMCDVESYIYLPLLEETGYVPEQKYSFGYEIRAYAEMLVEKYGLRDKGIFRVRLNDLVWNDDSKEWTVNLDREDGKGKLQIRGDFVISNTGAINLPKLPDLPGMSDFEGHQFHTCRWDYDYTGGTPERPDMTKLKDKRVGIIGTGATAVQAIPELGKWAKELYVFQRTPSAVDIRNNKATNLEWFDREVRGSGTGWQRRRAENFNLHVCNVDMDTDFVADEWTRMRTFSSVVGTPKRITDIPAFITSTQELDLPRQEKIRKRVDDIVSDKATAENLKPWYSGWCKRPCFHDDYLPTFNRPNVKLVDTNGKGINRVTKSGMVVDGVEYPLDVVIFGTGYYIKGAESPAGKGGFKAYGRGHVDMDDKWGEGVATLQGLITDGFPNFFFCGPNQAGACANVVYTIDVLSEHIVFIIAEALKRSEGKRAVIEPSITAEEEWVQKIVARAGAFANLAGCTPSYFNAEGEADKPKSDEEIAKAARCAPWGEGIQSYVELIKDWRADGKLDGLIVT